LPPCHTLDTTDRSIDGSHGSNPSNQPTNQSTPGPHLHPPPPSPPTKNQAVKAVCEFARKTGDYPSLSKVDLRVLALSYTLEAEHHGGSVAHLRTAPATPLTVQPQQQQGQGQGQKAGVEGSQEQEEEEEEEEDSDEESEEGGSSEEDDESGSSDVEGEEVEEVEQEKGATKPAAAPLPSAGLKTGFSWAQAVKTAAPPAAKPVRCAVPCQEGVGMLSLAGWT
jgi:hypothetical protein